MEAMLTELIESQLRELGEDGDVGAEDDLVMIGFDSIAYVRLISYLEHHFDIEIPDSDVTIEHFGTVANMAAYLERRGAPAPPPPGGAS